MGHMLTKVHFHGTYAHQGASSRVRCVYALHPRSAPVGLLGQPAQPLRVSHAKAAATKLQGFVSMRPLCPSAVCKERTCWTSWTAGAALERVRDAEAAATKLQGLVFMRPLCPTAVCKERTCWTSWNSWRSSGSGILEAATKRSGDASSEGVGSRRSSLNSWLYTAFSASLQGKFP
eukprot:1157556-Pelagomonas_calceolata.AAC.2